jgi:hypothetical protein
VGSARLRSIELGESISHLKTEREYASRASCKKPVGLRAIDRFDQSHESASTGGQ